MVFHRNELAQDFRNIETSLYMDLETLNLLTKLAKANGRTKIGQLRFMLKQEQIKHKIKDLKKK